MTRGLRHVSAITRPTEASERIGRRASQAIEAEAAPAAPGRSSPSIQRSALGCTKPSLEGNSDISVSRTSPPATSSFISRTTNVSEAAGNRETM